MFFIFLAVLSGIAAITLTIMRSSHNSKILKEASKQYEGEQLEAVLEQNQFAVPGWVRTTLFVSVAVFAIVGLFHKVYFYAEPGYIYHVRTILGDEKMVDDVGYNMYLFGRYNSWKKSMSIVAKAQYSGVNEDSTEAEGENDNMTSSILGPVRTIFLDQVDSQISATTRFMLPANEDQFFAIARQYRSPDNLLRTTLLPAFRETLQANAALMGAEDYFSGGRTQFNIDFDDQLKNGLFLVKRKEVIQRSEVNEQAGSANTSLETAQKQFGDDEKVVFVVEKLTDSNGVPIRKIQSYADLGIVVVESRITDVVPNAKFNDRMQLKQQASADRAIAREQRIQEEEQKLLAEAKGAREVAEKKATALVNQIEKTTDALTTKQLAITNAEQLQEAAEIDRQRSEILLLKARIDAEAVQVAADAQAYKKRVVLKADNALAQKLEAEVAIQTVWAEAYAIRPVPTTVFGGGTEGMPGSIDEVTQFLRLKTVEAAENLSYSRDVAPATK